MAELRKDWLEDKVLCTGCGRKLTKRIAIYGDHADTYSGTVWHCRACAKACSDEPSEA